MKYIVKVTHTKGNETQIWFNGKGGYSRKQIKWLPKGGWSRRYFAEQYIKKCQEYSEEMKHHGGEQWSHKYEILEV